MSFITTIDRTYDTRNGALKVLKDAEALKSLLHNFILSNYFERPFNLTSGLNAEFLLFDLGDLANVESAIEDHIEDNYPDVDNVVVSINKQPNSEIAYITISLSVVGEKQEITYRLRQV